MQFSDGDTRDDSSDAMLAKLKGCIIPRAFDMCRASDISAQWVIIASHMRCDANTTGRTRLRRGHEQCGPGEHLHESALVGVQLAGLAGGPAAREEDARLRFSSQF